MYEAFYHLQTKPFQLSPDPRFFFSSRGHRRAVAYLVYGAHQGEGFIVITGEIGAGKTMLAATLAQKLAPKNLVLGHVVNTRLGPDDLVRMVAAAFGLPQHDSKAVLLDRVREFLLACNQQGRRPLLIVDEAQNLPSMSVEELRMLSNFVQANRPLLQTFLLGQPEFRKTLQGPDMEQLRQRVIASYHLGPLDHGETEAYILHRLKVAGWQGDPTFSPDAFAAIQPIHRRHSAQDQHPVRPPDAHGLPGPKARLHRCRGRGRDRRDAAGVFARRLARQSERS